MNPLAVSELRFEGADRNAIWRSERGVPPPKRIVEADDRINAAAAFALANEGTAMLWRGDFHNARQLLQALSRRIEARVERAKHGPPPGLPGAFHLHRQSQAQRATTLSRLLIPIDADYAVPLRRAPTIRDACVEAWGPPEGGLQSITSLRELLGVVGAHEWRKKGVEVPALGARIHPHYGVFAPIRGEYVDLVAQAKLPIPVPELAFDIGAGTGVLAALLARRGVARVVATELDVRALDCARDNLQRLALGRRVEVVETDLFPAGRAPLMVCNPPWLPGKPSAPMERAIYDQDSRMLKGYLSGLAAHLEPGGEGWLILSDLAEHLGLRLRSELEAWIANAGLKVIGRIDTRPTHRKAGDSDDPFYAARSREVTSLWRLGVASP